MAPDDTVGDAEQRPHTRDSYVYTYPEKLARPPVNQSELSNPARTLADAGLTPLRTAESSTLDYTYSVSVVRSATA